MLALVLTRGTTFYVDEVVFFQTGATWDVGALLSPLNGHLMLLPRAVYAACLDLLGASYLPYRLVQVAGVVVLACLFLVFARPRVGDIALVPAIMLLFLGSSWETTLTPLGIPIVWSMAFGLGALLSLESAHRRTDFAACLLLCACVATHSTGLPFVAACGAYLLLDRRRWPSAWVVLVPALLYGVWLLAKPELTMSFAGLESNVRLENVATIPEFFLNAAGAVVNALLGLNFDGNASLLAPDNTDPPWGIAFAALLGALGAVRFAGLRPDQRRGVVPTLVLLTALWTSYALVESPPERTAEQGRYLLPGALAMLMAAADLARGARPGHKILFVAVPLLAVSLWVNVMHFQQGGRWLRFYSAHARGQFAAVDLARDQVRPDFSPTSGVGFFLGLRADAYLSAVEAVGSPAFSHRALLVASDSVKAAVDQTLVAALPIDLSPAPDSCASALESAARPAPAAVREGRGVWVSANREGVLGVQRFARTSSVPVGTLGPRRWYRLRLPPTTEPGTWRLALDTPSPYAIKVVPTRRGMALCRRNASGRNRTAETEAAPHETLSPQARARPG